MVRTQSVDGDRIAYERHGEGQSLVLLHGGMAPREYWTPVLPHLEGYAAVVPQRPGFGTCLDGPDETPSGEVLVREAEYVRALVEAVDGDPIRDEATISGLDRTPSVDPVESIFPIEETIG